VLFEVRDDEQTVTILHFVRGARDYPQPDRTMDEDDNAA
jgi:hypothetical protein